MRFVSLEWNGVTVYYVINLWCCGYNISHEGFYMFSPFLLQLLKSNPERVYTSEREGLWWRRGLEGETCTELRVMAEKGRGLWSQLTASEKSKLYDAIGYLEDVPSRPEKPKQYIGTIPLFLCYSYL